MQEVFDVAKKKEVGREKVDTFFPAISQVEVFLQRQFWVKHRVYYACILFQAVVVFIVISCVMFWKILKIVKGMLKIFESIL